MPHADVTILTRTLGRPCLADAAASVAAQTVRPREWLVVDASGEGVAVPPAGDVPVRVVGAGARLPRSRAANLGLDRAEGARAIILDDDDLLLPDAVKLLSAALDAHPEARVAYGDVRTDCGGLPGPARFAYEYSELLLLRRNLFPPNAAMFDMSLVREHAVRVDESLDWFEDWDLWLSMSAHTAFVHVAEEVGIYRMVLSQSGIWLWASPDADPRIRQHKARVEARYAQRRRAAEAQHRALKLRALALRTEDRIEEALDAWIAAAGSDPLDPEPPVVAARLLVAAGRANDARAVLESAIARMPKLPGLLVELARACELAGEPALAAMARSRADALVRAIRAPRP
jgi:tetratricopeptide (TPR) repeat protein